MADSKISDLAAVTDILDTDEYVVARAGASKKITGANLKAGTGGGVEEMLDGADVEILALGNELLTWDFHISGANLLDLTDPATPLFIAAGTYTVTVSVAMEEAMDAGDAYNVLLNVGLDTSFSMTSGQAGTLEPKPWSLLSVTRCLPAEAPLFIEVNSQSGDTHLFFIARACVVRHGT